MDMELLLERFALCKERIGEIVTEGKENPFLPEAYQAYFASQAFFITKMFNQYESCQRGEYRVESLNQRSLTELLKENRSLYEEILPEHYEDSFANPAKAVAVFGKESGQILTYLAAEMRSLIEFAFEQKLESFLIRAELFLEVYGAVSSSFAETKKPALAEELRNIIYWFVSDYSETENLEIVKGLVCPTDNFFVRIVKEADFSNPAYLFAYGEYITEDEIRIAQYLNDLDEETIHLMADTYTEGYRKGFELANKDLSKKKTVEIRYVAGFERVVRRAIENFEKLGLYPVIYRCPTSIMRGFQVTKVGMYGNVANRQYDYDHKSDLALIYDRKLAGRLLEETRAAFEQYKEWARFYAGPAVMEVFGETPFSPVSKNECISYSKEQQEIKVEYFGLNKSLQSEYIIQSERSFTIIAYPVPQIGERFEEIFTDIIKVNTLDYKVFMQIQQRMIDALNQCDHVMIKGTNGNRTDLCVNLYKLEDPSRETIFENCVADVNIPVGEVFTTPKLEGTNGILHVTTVFLEGLQYKDLVVEFENGMTKEYSCKNFEEEEKNKSFVKENLLYRFDSLAMGEFAIGTNTTAYMVARKYGIEDRFPILIAEKTGPHFAVGDTCYSRTEEIRVYNPDKKEIVAKDNAISLLRKTDPSKAYFNCHTDITIPYDELGELYGVKKDGSRVDIILNGRFVLEGCEVLNEPFSQF